MIFIRVWLRIFGPFLRYTLTHLRILMWIGLYGLVLGYTAKYERDSCVIFQTVSHAGDSWWFDLVLEEHLKCLSQSSMTFPFLELIIEDGGTETWRNIRSAFFHTSFSHITPEIVSTGLCTNPYHPQIKSTWLIMRNIKVNSWAKDKVRLSGGRRHFFTEFKSQGM